MTVAGAPAPAVLVPLGARAGRTRWTVAHEGRVLVAWEVDGEVRVTDATCPHKGGPLAEGVVRSGAVVCPWHWYAFDLRTGACTNAHGVRLRTYPVVERDGQLYAEVAPVVRRSWADVLRAHARGDG